MSGETLSARQPPTPTFRPIADDDTARRMDPQPGDTFRVRPWDMIRERDVYERGADINGPFVRFRERRPEIEAESRPGVGGRTQMSLDQWQDDARRPLVMSEEEAEAHRLLYDGFAVLGRAERLARHDGHHCLSCVDSEDARGVYWTRAQAGEDAEVGDDDLADDPHP